LSRSTVASALALSAIVSGCGSSGSGLGQRAASTLTSCLRARGYAIEPESRSDIQTAPTRFEFVTVVNASHQSWHDLTLTVSRSEAGAIRAAEWLRSMNSGLVGAVTLPTFPV